MKSDLSPKIDVSAQELISILSQRKAEAVIKQSLLLVSAPKCEKPKHEVRKRPKCLEQR
jgi:hypothetical protein